MLKKQVSEEFLEPLSDEEKTAANYIFTDFVDFTIPKKFQEYKINSLLLKNLVWKISKITKNETWQNSTPIMKFPDKIVKFFRF